MQGPTNFLNIYINNVTLVFIIFETGAIKII